ncbi:hypothetical protein SNE35_25680 [Paucibacter sp. R3-3]|uniref:Uncharacterized protein n=2 Tax=Roseateles agri TaxID=3098619 RepID=A0ABU5DNM9_9BURK|nr:hypothetical protein [Paucibacter sp. R3-3]
MKPAVKSAVESALVALLAAGCCLWFLISAANLEDPPAARMAFLGIGLGCSIVAHWTFMGVVLKRSGRGLFPWMLAIVLMGPVGTAALLALLASEDNQQTAA